MIPKKNRADKKAIENIFKKGIFVHSTSLSLKYLYKKDEKFPARVSFIIPKTVEKKATNRNFLKRIGYVKLSRYFNKIPKGFTGVFILNKNKGNSKKITEEDIGSLLYKGKIINKSETEN